MKTGLALLLCCLLVIILFLTMRDTLAPRIELKSASRFIRTRASSIVLEGLVVDSAPSHVLLNEQKIAVDVRGVFRRNLGLKDGRQVYVIVPVDRSGNRGEAVELTVVRDIAAPQIKLRSIIHIGQGLVTVKGQMDEPGTVFMGQNKVEVAKELFELSVDLKDIKGQPVLRGEDLIGNSCSFDLPIIVVGKRGSGSHTNFIGAFKSSRGKGHIYVRAGVYQYSGKIAGDLSIIGLASPKETVLACSGRSNLALEGFRLTLRNLALKHGNPEQPMLEQTGGVLSAYSCEFDSRGQAAYQTNGRGEREQTRFHFEDCRFLIGGEHGLKIKRAVGSMSNCLIRDSKKIRLIVEGSWGLVKLNEANVSLRQCAIVNSKKNGMLVHSSMLNAELCRFEGHTGQGMLLKDNTLADFFGCTFRNNRLEAMELRANTDARLQGCHLSNNGHLDDIPSSAIRVVTSSKLIMSRCIIEKNRLFGLRAASLARVFMRDCQFSNNGPQDWQFMSLASLEECRNVSGKGRLSLLESFSPLRSASLEDFKDYDWARCGQAIATFVRQGKAALPLLWSAAQRGSMQVRYCAGITLGKLGTVSLPSVRRALQSGNKKERETAAVACYVMGEQARALEGLLLAQFGHGDIEAAFATYAICRMKPSRKGRLQLYRWTKHHKAFKRGASILTLRLSKDWGREAFQAVVDSLMDPNFIVQKQALDYLGDIPTNPLILKIIRRTLEGATKADLRYGALRSLCRHLPKAPSLSDDFMRALSSKKSSAHYRELFVYSLRLGGVGALPVLDKVLAKREAFMAVRTAICLGSEASPVIATALKNSQLESRRLARIGLGIFGLGAREKVSALLASLDSAREDRDEVALWWALSRIAPDHPELKRALSAKALERGEYTEMEKAILNEIRQSLVK